MHDALRRHVAGVAVPRDARHVAPSARIGEHGERRVGLVPVVIPFQDARRVQRTQILPNKSCSLSWVQSHTRIVSRLEMRLVLHRDRENRHALGRVRGDEAREVRRVRRIRVVAQRTLDHAARRLHPRRRAPRRCDNGKSRVERQRALEDRQRLGAVGIDREVRHRRILLSRRHVVVAVLSQREVRRAHVDPDEAQPSALEEFPHE